MRSRTVWLISLSAVTYAGVKSSNVDWTWLRVRILIFQWMNAFELQNFLNEAAERNALLLKIWMI